MYTHLHAYKHTALLDDDPISFILSFFFFIYLEITRRQIEEVRIDIISPYNM